ncbi:hypothetical protein GGR53DRAFT_469538 [Hypoxylon sp. FL1150]|nr:hypothetical protein GGR53DRAFT_469538 [Hypoxylon sp. FL1150]
MSLLAPRWHVWKDSRLYLNDIAEIRFQRVSVTDTLVNYPIRVVFRNGEVSVHTSKTAFSLSPTNEERTWMVGMVNWVKNSDFCQILREAVDGIEPSGKPDSAELDYTRWTDPQMKSATAQIESIEGKPDMTASDTDFVLWVFPRDLYNAQQCPEWKYSLRKLPSRREWMVAFRESAGPTDSGWFYRPDHSLSWVHNDDLAYSANENNGLGTTLGCPYIPYDEVQKLRGYNWGFRYVDFIQQLHLSPQHQSDARRLLEFREALCKECATEAKEPPTVIFNEASCISGKGHSGGVPIANYTIGGFFNDIPSSSVAAHCEDNIRGFSFVSSSWVDWKAFVVKDELPRVDYPKLKSDAGEPVNCLGVIQGY